MAVPLSHGFEECLKKNIFEKVKKVLLRKKERVSSGNAKLPQAAGKKVLFSKILVFHFSHRIFKICLARSFAMIPTLDPYKGWCYVTPSLLVLGEGPSLSQPEISRFRTFLGHLGGSER